VARMPLWLKAALLAIPALLLVVFIVLIAVGWYVKRHMLDSGGTVRPRMAAYDVRHYALDVAVSPAEESIFGSNLVTVEATADVDVFEIHLDDRLDVRSVAIDGAAASFEHERGLITVELGSSWSAGSRHRVDIAYGGRPKVALKAPWIDGFVWGETPSGEPWVGVTSEGDGGDIWWPCKDHPSDEPDEGMEISLTVPAGLVGLANGRPIGEVANADGSTTSRWRVGFPINNYAVSVNVAPYVPIELAYHGIDGSLDETIVFWVIPEFEDRARRLFRQLPGVLEVFGNRFGEYPFFADKLWVVHAPYHGMEHQTLVAYGDDFEDNEFGFGGVFVHELAHEWWGNKITARDWADFWLHEGFASYAEALLVLDTQGEQRYLEYMGLLRHRMTNAAPVVQGVDLTSLEAYSPDIYGKGAWVLHMLRSLVGEEAMDEILWRFADGDHSDGCRLVGTDELIDLVAEISGRDLAWFWQRYLYTAELPSWTMRRTSGGRADRVSIEWDSPSFEMPLPVRIGDRIVEVEMADGCAELEVGPGVEVVVDPRREVLALSR